MGNAREHTTRGHPLKQKLLGLLGSLGLVLVQDKRDAKGNQRGNREHDRVLHGLGQAQQDTEDTGNARAGGSQRGERADQGAATAADAAGDEGLKEAQVHTKDGRLGNTHEGGQSRRKRQALDLGIAGLKGNGERGATLSDVGSAGDGQPVGHAILGELTQVDGGVHLVDTGNDRGGIEQADDKGTDAEGQGQQGLDQTEDGVFGPDKDGADGNERHEHGHEHRDERGHKEVEHLGNDLVQALLEEGQNGAGDNDGDHMALIANPLKAVHAGDDRDHGLNALGGNRVGALQRGVDKRTADDGTQVRIGAKCLSRGVADQNLQNAKGRARNQVGDLVDKVIGVERDKAVGGHKVEGTHNAQQQARSHDGGDDGDKDVAEHLNSTHKDILLLRRSLLDLGLGGSLDAAERDELFVDLVDGASAKNNLELALGLKDALSAVDILEGLLVNLGVIGNHQAQTRGAMRGRDDVVGATDVVEHLLG